MKNESADHMIAELKSSPLKMGFMIFLVLGGMAGGYLHFFPSAKAISISYSEMMSDIYLSERTALQEKKAKDKYIGSRVTWSGEVIDVQGQVAGYRADIGQGGTLFTDITLNGLSEREALRLDSGMEVRFSGVITQIQDARITGYVHLSDVEMISP